MGGWLWIYLDVLELSYLSYIRLNCDILPSGWGIAHTYIVRNKYIIPRRGIPLLESVSKYMKLNKYIQSRAHSSAPIPVFFAMPSCCSTRWRWVLHPALFDRWALGSPYLCVVCCMAAPTLLLGWWCRHGRSNHLWGVHHPSKSSSPSAGLVSLLLAPIPNVGLGVVLVCILGPPLGSRHCRPRPYPAMGWVSFLHIPGLASSPLHSNPAVVWVLSS
jgi:hypothetical protein